MPRVIWLPCLLAMGCAPTEPPLIPPTPLATGPGVAASASANAGVVEPGAGPTPLPVAAPGNLLVMARSRPTIEVARELGKLVGLPIETMLSLAGPDVMRLDASLGAVVLLDAAAGDELVPGLLAAFSVPVKSEQAFTAMADRDPATWRQRGVGYVVKQGPLGGAFCKPVVSVGDAPMRVVCGPTEQDVNAVSPFLTRGLPQAELPPGDVRLEVKLGPLKSRYLGVMRERQQQASMLSWGGGLLLGGVTDPAVLAAPGAVLDEGVKFLEAIEGVSAGGKIDGAGRQLELGGQLRLAQGSPSWLVRVLTSRSEKATAPDLFWRLPRTSQVALWGRGIDATLTDEPRRILRRGAALALEKFDVGQGDRRAIDEALAAFPRGDSPWGLGFGSSGQGEAAKGWLLVGSEVPSAVYGSWLRKTGQAIRSAMSAASKAGVTGVKDARAAVKIEDSPAGFPAGSTLLELSGSPGAMSGMGSGLAGLGSGMGSLDLGSLDLGSLDLGGGMGLPDLAGLAGAGASKKPAPRPAPGAAKRGAAGPAVVMVAVPDGRGDSWLVMGDDRVVLRARVAEALARAPREGQLGSLPEAEARRGESANFGGMLALGEAVDGAMQRSGKGGGSGVSVPVWLAGEIDPRGIGVKGRLSARGLTDLGGMLGGLLRR